MKELQNFVYRHMDALKHHKRYLAMLTALSMLVTFIVPLILVEPADSMTGILVCNKTVHTHNAECYVGDTLICDIEEHIHTNDCYKKLSTVSLKGDSSSGTSHAYNIPVPNAGGGQNADGSYTSANAHEVVNGEGYYNPAELPLYTLLFGEGVDWVDTSESLENNLEIADDEYFLGFASDFCAFIESDFTAFDADAEGRVFIGGDLIFNGNPQVGEWNYQVGAGDYGHFIPLTSTGEYEGISGFASGIIGGKVYRLGTIATGSTATVEAGYNLTLPAGRGERHSSGYDVFLYPEEGAYKRFIVGNLAESLHLDEDYEEYGDGTTKDVTYGLECNHLYYDNDCSVCGDDLTTVTNEHSYLKTVNELSQFYQYTDVRTILEKTFDTLRARSLSLASVQAIDVTVDNDGKLVLDASDIGDAKTVYFRLDDWNNVKQVEIIVPENRVTTGTNIYASGTTITNLDLNIIVTCDDESVEIQKADTFIKVGGTSYPIHKTGGNDTNNHPVSSNILYNFFNATKVEFLDGANFNGTVFALNANVETPEKCPGHLSGALIAKSFYGGLEFGYRPYRGGVDIFGMTSGYAIPVNKFGDDGETALPGALFAIKQDGKFVSLFESGYGTNFAALPSKVDFSGKTAYEQDEISGGSGNRDYAGNTVIGEKLTAPVDFTLYYKDSNGNNQIITDDTNLENLTVFYLEPNQKVNLDSNENFVYTYDENNNIYTIYPIKLVDSFTITAKNAADNTSEKTSTVNFNTKTAAMELTVDKEEVTLNDVESDEVSLGVTNPPTGNTIYYKYFANGNEIRANDSTQDDGYTTQSSGSYTPTVAGGLELKVKAYVKVGNDYYEVESATGNKVTVKDFQFDEDMAIRIPESINSGEKLTINVDNAPSGATIYYTFYNSSEQSGNEFDTNGIVGENLKVKARVVVGNQSMTLEDTITVNFPENHGITLNASQTEYEVNSYDKLYFSIQNADHYQNKTVTYYFNDKPIENNGNSVAKTIVGDSYAYAVISVNGLELKTESVKVTGKYHDQLGLNLSQGPYTAGNNINLSVNYAPNGAKVVFEVLNSNNESVFTSDEKTVSNGEATATFTPQTAGNYTFKAYMTFESNTKRNFETKDIKVAARPVYGELSVDPQQVNTGDKVNLKVYNATSGATVSFEIFQKSDLNNSIKTINGHEGNSGEYTAEYTPTLSGEFVVKAIISKDGVTNSNNTKELTVNENTSTLSGKWEVKSTGTEPGSNVQIYVSEAPNNAIIKIYVTKPGGTEELVRNENMNNSTYNWNYQLSNRGTYKFRGELVRNGEIYNLGEKEITIANIIGLKVISGYNSNQNFEIDKPVTLGLETVPENTARIDYYLVSLDASKPMHEIGENRIVCSYNDDMTITFTPGQTGDHQYCAKAYNTDGELIGTMTSNVTFKTVAPEYSVTIKTKVGDTYTTDFYGGDTVTLEISDIPSGRTITNVNATIENNNVNEWNVVEAGKTYTFVTSNYEGYFSDEEKTLTVKVYFDNGYSATASIQIINRKRPETTTASTNSDATTTTTVSAASYSVRRYLSILADENTNSSPDDALIVINGNGETFKSVKLTFPGDVDAKNASFTIKATFKDVGGDVIDEKTYSNSDVADGNYIDITNINSNVATIEITPVTGSITIANCYPTFTKTENIITQKYAQDFTLKQSEQKEIVIVNWAIEGSTQILDSIIINLDEITNANEGDVYCALIPKVNEGETAVVDFKKATISNNKIEIKDINAAIEKIKIYTTKPSLTINDYTISAFVGSSKYSEDELKAFRTQTQDIINYYTLVEQQAPVGYFKEDTVYIVEVKESIMLDSLKPADKGTYPEKVETTVTVKKTDGTEVLSYVVDVDYSSSNGTEEKIITIVDNDENPDNNVKFTLTKDEDGNLTVEYQNADVDVSKWSTTTKPVSNDGYYFDPEAMMVVPVPTPIEYENTIGLHFRKIDNKGASVNGVKIELYEGDSKVTDTNLWYWNENSSDWLIDYTQLNPESVYRLTETDAGGMFEPSEDIYFKKTGDDTDKEIMYWIGSATMPEESKVKVLDLTEDYESRVIRMENIRIPGLKPTVVKTDLNGNVINGEGSDAVFSLHANNGTELLDKVTIEDGRIELDLSNPGANKTAYIENGYLKPGTYYLKEIKAPSGYEPSMKFFYFNVEQNEKGAFSITPVEKRPGISVLTEKIDNENCEVIRFTKNALDEISDDKIKNNNIILQFTLNTSVSDEVTNKYKNYRFMGNHNEQYYKQAKKEVLKANITYKLTAGDMLKLLGITPTVDNPDTTDKNEFVEQFRQLSVFEIVTVNSTKVVDWQFLEFEDKAENISKIIIEDSSNVKINDFKITYNNGSSFNKGNNDIKIENNELQLPKGCSLNNVAKIELTASEFDGEKKVIIETTDGRRIWGDKTNTHNDYPNYSDSYKMIKKDVACVFGFDPDTTSNNPETSTTYNFPTLTVRSDDRNTVYISNDVLKPTMKLRAEKKWVGDTNITELRKPVEVQLMQKQVGGENDFDYIAFNPTIDKDEQSTEDGEQSTEGGEQSTEGDEQSTEGDEQSTEDGEQSTEGGEQSTEGNEQSTSGRVTLNEANNWSYIWEDLPRYVNGVDADAGLYYYTVKEITTVPGYETVNPKENINEGGTIVITNTAKTVDVPVKKTWTWDTTKYNNPSIPRTVVFKLQVKVNNAPEQWMDVPGKTLKLTGNGTAWNGEFTGLIEGYEYKIVEVDVPYGWTPTIGDNVDISTENGNRNFTVNNTYEIKEGSIALQKLWQDLTGNEDAALPTEIYLDLYRSVVAPSYTDTDAPYTDDEFGSTVDGKPKYMSDYARLLQHSLYFYDANMCGTDVAEKSALAWRTNCHTEDAVPGGYHDAGDHVMFGLPQGYTASMLGWMYLEFIKENTTGNKIDTNDAEHFKVILERFYEFFANSVEYGADEKIKKLLVQKGHGNVDHLIWCAPEIQKNRESEMIWSETSGSNIAAEYAAALALGYLNFYDSNSTDEEEKEKYQKYLKLAEDLYEFAGRTSSFVASDSMGEYYADTDSGDDIAWAAAWLFEATGKQDNSPYKDARSDSTGELQWDDVNLAAAIAKARQTNDWSKVTKFIDDTYINGNKKDYYYIHPWGTARFNATAQTATLIVAKHLKAKGDTDTATKYVDWAKDQMNKLLGDNNWKDTISEDGCVGGTVEDTNLPICLVTNFVPNGYDVDTPQAPHHRAASGLDSVNGDSNEEYLVNCGYDDDSYALIGALVGGPSFGSHDDGKQTQMYDYGHDHPLADHTYIDDLHDYCCNEVAIDYNSGLVGAAAGLYYFLGSGERSTMIEGVEYGSYGLENANELGDTYYDSANGLKSPTISAPPQVTQNYNLDPVNDVVLKGFAMKQTSVRIMEDSDTIEIHKLEAIVWNQEPKPANADEVTLYYYNSSTGQITTQTITNVESSGNADSWWYPWNLQNVPTDNFVGVSIKAPNSKNSKIKIALDSWGLQEEFYVSDDGTATWGTVSESAKIVSDYSTIAICDTLTLTYSDDSVTPNWSVANKDTSITNELASMTGNVLTPKGVGVVVVTASDSSDNELDTKEITIEEFAISGSGSMTKNGTQTLKTNSIGTVNWSLSDSSPTNVITVNESGSVTAIGIGTATVVATNGSYSDELEITVTKQMPQLTFNGNATIYVGGETYFNLTPDVDIQYKDANGNETGLTVDDSNNKVTANAPGYYTLWIEDSEGDKSDELSLTVKPQISIDGNNSTNGSNTTIDVGNYITFNLNPDSAIQYSCTDSSITNGLTVDDDNNKITAAKAGTYKVWTYVNGVKSDEIELTVTDGTSNEPSGVTAPDGYELVYVKNENKLLSNYTVFGKDNVPTELSGQTIDYIIVEFYTSDSSKEYNGNLKINGSINESFINKVDKGGKKHSIPDNILRIPISPGVEISSLEFEGWYNGDNLAQIKNIYFYYLPPSLTITHNDQKTDEVEITEGEKITLKQMHKAENSSVTWKLNDETVASGTDEYNFTAPNVDEATEYTITASDGTNEDTITINVNPLTFTPIDKITELRPITLELNTTRGLDEFEWTSSDPSIISVVNGEITVKNNGKATITATDSNGISARIEVEADVTTTPLTISGNNSTGIGGEIQLTYSGGPLGVDRYEWTSDDDTIATVDQNGKVVGIAPGNVEITLTAYDKDGEVLESDTMDIEIKDVYSKTVYPNSTVSGSNPNAKYYYSLSDLPKGAILKSVSINVSPTGNEAVSCTGALMLGKENEPNKLWKQKNFSSQSVPVEGYTFTINEETYLNGIDCSNPDHVFSFGLWSCDATVNINWVTFEYERDTTYIEIMYDDNSESKTIRNGESVTFKVAPTGGTIGSVKLMKGETVIDTYDVTDPAATFTHTISPAAGEYTIIAAMSGENSAKTASLSLTVKDDFSISQDNVVVSGATFADINSTSTFKVNNLMGDGPDWRITADEEVYDVVEADNIITIKEKDINGTTGKTIATFDKNTGKLTTSGVDGDFTITATDSYGNGSTASVMVTVTDRPKLPELPKEIFLGNKIDTIILTKEDKLGNEIWAKEVKNLPMTDEKGNPYYYYIQESGYSVNGTYHPMESTDNFIYSSNASFMPYNYYDNGIVPVENPNDQNPVKVAKVGNKFLSKQEGQLPSTGGSGVTTYYYLGGVIMLLSIAGFTGLKRRERKRRKE